MHGSLYLFWLANAAIRDIEHIVHPLGTRIIHIRTDRAEEFNDIVQCTTVNPSLYTYTTWNHVASDDIRTLYPATSELAWQERHEV